MAGVLIGVALTKIDLRPLLRRCGADVDDLRDGDPLVNKPARRNC